MTVHAQSAVVATVMVAVPPAASKAVGGVNVTAHPTGAGMVGFEELQPTITAVISASRAITLNCGALNSRILNSGLFTVMSYRPVFCWPSTTLAFSRVTSRS